MLFERVSKRTGVSPEICQEIIDATIDEMGWPEIDAYNKEWRRGQQYDDVGGYFMRCIGRLFGARHKYDELPCYKEAMKAMIKEAQEEALASISKE